MIKLLVVEDDKVLSNNIKEIPVVLVNFFLEENV